MEENNLPLYIKIKNQIKRKIEDNELRPGDKLPTEIELAEQYEVSRITSKKALEELKKEGYIYRKRGKGSFVSSFCNQRQLNNNKIISMILPAQSKEGNLIEYMRGASEVLTQKGYLLTVQCTDNNILKERQLLMDIYDSPIGGVIYYPYDSINNLDILGALYINGYPIVTIDKYYDALPITSVVSDNFKGGYDLTDALLKKTKDKIAFVSVSTIGEKSSVRDRYLGYCKALKDNNFYIDSKLVVNGYNKEVEKEVNIDSKEYLKNKIEYFIKMGVKGIIAENDYIARDIISILNNFGDKEAQKIYITGFDNLGVLTSFSENVIEAEQEFYEIGKKAAEVMLEIIENNEYKYKKITLPVKIIT